MLQIIFKKNKDKTKIKTAKKAKRKFEFSKIFLLLSVSLAIYIVTVSTVLMFRTNDLSPLSYLIPAIFAELATCSGFYYWKAKSENQIKIAEEYKKKQLSNSVSNNIENT